MTVREYLKSKQFKKEYKCWNYDHIIVDQNDVNIYHDSKYEYLQLWEDDNWNEFVDTHEVVSVERCWELGDDHEMYAYAKIIVKM